MNNIPFLPRTPNKTTMSWSTTLLLSLSVTLSLVTGATTYQLNPNGTHDGTKAHKDRATDLNLRTTLGRSFFLTAGHRMKGDISSDLHGHLYRRLGDYSADSPQQCALACLSTPNCRSISYKRSVTRPKCHLHDIGVDDYVMLVRDSDWDVFSTFEDSSKDWMLVFFSLAGSGPPPYQIFTSSETGIWRESICSSSADCIGTFKNSFIEHWSSLPVTKVKLVLYKDSKAVVELEFDGQGSNKTNWFSKKRLLRAKPWNDIFTEKQNYFSMEGEDKLYKRRFYINKGYGSCKGDIGWLLVRDNDVGAVCDIEPQDYPQFLYSKKTKYQKRPDYAMADKLEIFVSLK